MRQAVQQRCGHPLTLEDLAPLAERQVARYQDAPPLVAVGEHPEHFPGPAAHEAGRVTAPSSWSPSEPVCRQPSSFRAIVRIWYTAAPHSPRSHCSRAATTQLGVDPTVTLVANSHWRSMGPEPGQDGPSEERKPAISDHRAEFASSISCYRKPDQAARYHFAVTGSYMQRTGRLFVAVTVFAMLPLVVVSQPPSGMRVSSPTNPSGTLIVLMRPDPIT